MGIDDKKQDKPNKDAGGKPGPYGEGNYEATRKYNEGLKDHVQHHDIEKEARDAAPKNEGEAKAMKDAEREAASRSKGEDPALKSPKKPS
jgi:hypothetical protein